MPKLTLSMIVKNEERFLEGCIESVKNIADEIVIVDTGSSDKTIEIARDFGAKIYHFDWINDFSAARNYALSKSTGSWILYLDADERLSPESVKELKKIISSGKYEGVACKVKSESTKGGFPNIMYYIRLFRNHPKAKFTGKVHEQIVHSLIDLKYKFSKSDILIEHLGYDISNDDLKIKAGRNLKILLEEYEQKKDHYIAFQIAQSFAILNEKEKAVEYFKTFADDDNYLKEYRALAYRYMAGRELDNNKLDTALNYVNKGLSISRSQPLLLMIASQIHEKLGKKTEAADFCRKAYEENIKLLGGDVNTMLDIMVNEEILLYHGIELSLRIGDIQNFNFYLSRLEPIKNKQFGDKGVNELKLIKALLNNEVIPDPDINEFLKSINDANVNLIITLLGNYKQIEVRLLIVKKMIGYWGKNTKLLSLLGISFLAVSDFPNAVSALESAIESNEKDPSAYFYLISAYIKTEKWDLVKDTIAKAEEEFSNFDEVISRLNLIKAKINQFNAGK